MKTIRIGVIICVALLSITSCKKGGVFCYSANGDTVIEERSHTGFDQISVELAADLHVTQGAEYSVEIETSENLLEIIETKVVGSTLEIDLKNGKCIKGSSEVEIYVTIPELTAVSLSGSGDILIPNKMVGDELDISISGSGNIEIDSLDVDHFDTSISGSGDLFVTSIDTLESQKISISGSGKIMTINAPTKHVEIKISGSGECSVHAIETLDISISGSGDIFYKGNPSINQSISGSGSVRPY